MVLVQNLASALANCLTASDIDEARVGFMYWLVEGR